MHKKARHIVLGIQLTIVVFVGLFMAIGVNGVLAAVLSGITPHGSPSVPEEKAEEPGAGQATAAADNTLLYNRNLFNQSGGDGSSAPEPEPEEDPNADAEEEEVDEPPSVAPGAPVITDLQVLLVGTQVSREAEWSIAILKDLEDATADAIYRRLGQTFKEDATIVRIERKRVYFTRESKGNRVEYVDIETTEAEIRKRAAESRKSNRENKKKDDKKKKEDGDGGKGTGNDAKPETAPRVASAGSVGDVDPSAITDNGDGSFSVPREMAELVRGNPKMLKDPKFGTPPQIRPVYRGGGVQGFQVLGVQSSSIYGRLGIQNGDIIVDVNGKVVDNPQKALAFFDQLGPNSDVAVKVNRRGRHKTLTYSMK